MANLRQFSAAEALNTEAAGVWDVETVVTTTDSTVTHVNVSNYHNVILDTTSTICILFDTVSNTTATDGNNLEIPGGVTSIKIPKGLGSTIYLHWLRNGSTDATVRVILT
jgi:hypothetical protein